MKEVSAAVHVRAGSRRPDGCSVYHTTAQISAAAGPAAQLLCTPWQWISISRRLRWITPKLNLLFSIPEDDGWKAADRRRRDLQRNNSKVNYRRVIGSAVWPLCSAPRLLGRHDGITKQRVQRTHCRWHIESWPAQTTSPNPIKIDRLHTAQSIWIREI